MQKSPPRFVPTLTQVVTQPPISATPAAAHMPGASVSRTSAAQPTADDIAQQLRQQLLVRTRQYMEATITQVVEEAVQQAVKHASQHVSVNAS
jgi:hypothetical protein